MSRNESMQAFWQKKHKVKDQLYLSGNGEQTLDILQIRGEIFDNAQRMLNVGIGLAVWEDYCLSKGKTIDCLDICQEAIDRVSGRVKWTFLRPELLPVSKYDLITELLVAQHIDDETLLAHLSYCIRALKPEGVYSIQVPAFFNAKTVLPEADLTLAMQSGSVCRSIAWMDDAVRAVGGRIIKVGYRGSFPEYNSIWYIYHIEKE